MDIDVVNQAVSSAATGRLQNTTPDAGEKKALKI